MQTRGPNRIIADRYVLDDELGRGAAGMTLRAEDRLLGRDVALTLIHPALCDDEVFAARLSDETRRVASLSGPGLARLLDTGEEEGLLFLVREHVAGASARTLLERDGPFATEDAVRVCGDVLEGLAIAHEAGVLHLGVRLDDVTVTNDGAAFVTDLGVASAIAATRASDAARFLGDGLAPELARRVSGNGHSVTDGHRVDQADGADEAHGADEADTVDARADVFAVGCVLYELLTGHAPAGRTSPREVRADIPRDVDRVLARALAPDPRDRYADARAFAAALAATVDIFPFASTEDLAAGSRLEWLRTWIAAPFAIGAVAAAIIGLGLWFGRLEVGGPLGIRPADRGAPERSEPAVEILKPPSVATWDPFGDNGENDSTAAFAVDGDPSTAWRSENYFDGSLHKQGVGLVFDLGEVRDVTGFRLAAPNPGYVFHVAVGDDRDALVGAVGDPHVAEADTRGALEASGRYVLVWITTVVPTGDGTRAEIAEFRVVVEAA